jgi:hypothetical protein
MLVLSTVATTHKRKEADHLASCGMQALYEMPHCCANAMQMHTRRSHFSFQHNTHLQHAHNAQRMHSLGHGPSPQLQAPRSSAPIGVSNLGGNLYQHLPEASSNILHWRQNTKSLPSPHTRVTPWAINPADEGAAQQVQCLRWRFKSTWENVSPPQASSSVLHWRQK